MADSDVVEQENDVGGQGAETQDTPGGGGQEDTRDDAQDAQAPSTPLGEGQGVADADGDGHAAEQQDGEADGGTAVTGELVHSTQSGNPTAGEAEWQQAAAAAAAEGVGIRPAGESLEVLEASGNTHCLVFIGPDEHDGPHQHDDGHGLPADEEVSAARDSGIDGSRDTAAAGDHGPSHEEGGSPSAARAAEDGVPAMVPEPSASPSGSLSSTGGGGRGHGGGGGSESGGLGRLTLPHGNKLGMWDPRIVQSEPNSPVPRIRGHRVGSPDAMHLRNSVPLDAALHNVRLRALTALQEGQAMEEARLVIQQRLEIARAKRQAQWPQPLYSSTTPVILASPKWTARSSRPSGWKDAWPSMAPEQVIDCDKQLTSAMEAHLREERACFAQEVAMKQLQEEDLRRRARQAEEQLEAQRRQKQEAIERVAGKADMLYQMKQAYMARTSEAKNQRGTALVSTMAQQRTAQAAQRGQQQTVRAVSAEARRSMIEVAKARAIAADVHTHKRHAEAVTKASKPLAQQHAAAAKAHNAARVPEVMSRHTAMDDATKRYYASQVQEKQAATQRAAQRKAQRHCAESSAIASKITQKLSVTVQHKQEHEHVQQNAVEAHLRKFSDMQERYARRQATRAELETEWQSKARASVVAAYHSEEIRTSAGFTKRLPDVRPEVAAMLRPLMDSAPPSPKRAAAAGAAASTPPVAGQ